MHSILCSEALLQRCLFFFFLQPVAGLTNQVPVWDSWAGAPLDYSRQGSVRVWSTHQLDLDLWFGSRSTHIWTWTRTFGVWSSPDLGLPGPGPDFGQSTLWADHGIEAKSLAYVVIREVKLLDEVAGGIKYYKNFGSVVFVDLNQVKCVIGRVMDQGKWAIIDQFANTIAQEHY